MESVRAIRRAARLSLEAQFSTDWCQREPYRWLHPHFRAAVEGLTGWRAPEAYIELAALVPPGGARAAGHDLPRFVAQDRAALERLGGYERHVAETRSVPTRAQSWHDFFNMAVWAHFPRSRWALNAVHVDTTLGPIDPRNGRAPPQNVAAQLDESGVIVASSSPELLADLGALRFKRAFWERRAELAATTRFWLLGHGMLESLLAPHRGLSGKAVLLELPRAPHTYADDELRASVDERVAGAIASWRSVAPSLDPLPVLGIPGYSDEQCSEFYDDARYFRFQRRPRG